MAYIVSSGEVRSNLVINNGNRLEILSGGSVFNTIVSRGGNMFIQDGGVANGVITSSGYVTVSSGGTMLDANLADGGIFTIIHKGGILSSAIVRDGTWLEVSGSAYNIVLSNGKGTGDRTDLCVKPGGYVENLTIHNDTNFLMDSGAIVNGLVLVGSDIMYSIANGTRIENLIQKTGTFMNVNAGVTVDGAVVSSGGTMKVFFGGTANGIVENGGYVDVVAGANVTFTPNTFSGLILSNTSATVHSGTTVNDATINTNAQLYVYSGGVADRTIINPIGQLYVYADGSAKNATVNASGYLFVSSGGTANGIVENGGYVDVVAGANVTFTPNTFSGLELTNASATIHAGTTANKISLNSNGYLYVFSGGTANKIIVSSGGSLVVSSNGIVDSATINNNGWLTISSGGTATNVVWTPCAGKIVAEEGAYVSFSNQYFGVYYGSGNTLLSSAVAMNSTLLEPSCEMYVMSKGTADDTTVNSSGNLFILSGGRVDNTVVNYGGSVFVSGGKADNTIINDNGFFYVFSGGTAETVTVNSNGYLYVEIGGSATNIVASEGAYLGLDVASGTYAAGTSGGSVFEINDGKVSNYIVNDGCLMVSKGGIVKNAVVNNGGSIYVASTGIASHTTVNSRSRLTVSSGGTAVGIIENGGWVNIEESAIVTFVSNTISGLVLSNTSATVHSGTTATRASIERYGKLAVYSGGVTSRTSVNVYGTMFVSFGGVASRTTLNGNVIFSSRNNEYRCASGCMYVSEGGIADRTQINAGGVMWVFSGGLASNTSVYRLGFLNVSSSGMADNTTVGASGTLWITRGGIAKNTTIGTGGNLFVSEGRITGHLTIAEGAVVSVDSRTVIDFDISGHTAAAPALINNLALVLGAPVYTLTVSETQAGGVYTLADEVNVFNGTITVQNLLGEELGMLALNESLRIGDITYTLNLEDSLVLTVEAPDLIAPTVSNVQANITLLTNQDVVLTGDFTDNIRLASSLYKVGENAEWTAYVDGVNVTENTTVFFMSIDAAGNESEVVSYTVDNIDKIAPEQPVTTADIITPTNGDVLVTAIFSEDSAVKEYSLDGKNWGAYAGGVLFSSNRTAYFRGIDAAGNISEIASYTVTNIDRTAPAKPSVSVDVTTPTNQSVSVSATFDEDSSTKEYSFDGEDWHPYTKTLLLIKNEKVSFRGTDEAGNTSEVASLEVNNIDTVAPTDPTGLMTIVSDQTVVLIWNASTDDYSGVKEYVVRYSLNGQESNVLRTNGTSYVLNNADSGSYSWSVQAIDLAGNESAVMTGDAFVVSSFKPYTVEYSEDNFEHVITFAVTTPSLDAFRMPTGTYQLRVKQDGSSEWMTGDSIVAPESDIEPQLIKSDADGNADVFFANAVGTWESGYLAQHVGSTADTWGGTKEYATLFGKNKLADIIEGSTDANILLMTDDENGDALFVDDIYTASPGNIAEKQSRIAQIDEIRAGAGADIVDMTSQRFEYTGDGLTIRGGEGNDTIWANKGDNILFGDAGNDRIVGASGNDVIAGGIGNDRLHGGGGEDVFTFCDNWGMDNVEQLAGGSVMLWFASGSLENWNESTLTYNDGTNSVKVSGITADKITLKFGDDASDQYATLYSMGAFFDATSERIFEVSGKGLLVSL